MVSVDTSNYGVYVATRNDTDEVVYVGCSWKNVKDRLRKHIEALKGNRHPNSGLQKLWNAKGLTFTHVVKCLPIKKLVLAFEKGYGTQYDFSKLVNVNPLGKAGPDTTGIEPWNKGKKCPELGHKGDDNWVRKLSPEEYDEECKRRRERQLGEKSHFFGKEGWNKGKKCPQTSDSLIKFYQENPEYRLKASERMSGENNHMYGVEPWNKGKKCPEHSKKISGENHPGYGKPLVKETCNKISKTRIEKGVAKGENNPSSKITAVNARFIKVLLIHTKLTHQEIADSVPDATIYIVRRISQGKSWTDVDYEDIFTLRYKGLLEEL